MNNATQNHYTAMKHLKYVWENFDGSCREMIAAQALQSVHMERFDFNENDNEISIAYSSKQSKVSELLSRGIHAAARSYANSITAQQPHMTII